jgi:hypothetical protein
LALSAVALKNSAARPAPANVKKRCVRMGVSLAERIIAPMKLACQVKDLHKGFAHPFPARSHRSRFLGKAQSARQGL